MNEQIPEWLKQEAERKYPLIVETIPMDEDYKKIIRLQQSAYIAGALSRSGGVWVKAINQKPPDNKWPYEIVFRNITTKRVLDILSYWTEEKWEFNDADQNGTSVGTLIPISEIEWLNESPAADKGDAIEFARWLGEFCNPYVDNANVHTFLRDNKDYSLEQLYELFHQSKQTKK